MFSDQRKETPLYRCQHLVNRVRGICRDHREELHQKPIENTEKRKSYRSIRVNTTSWGNFITNFYRVCCIYFVFLWFITSSIDVQTSLPIINSRLKGSRYLSLADLLLHIIFVLWVILIQLNRTFYLFMPLSATYWNLSLIFLLLFLCIIIRRTLINSFHLHLVGAETDGIASCRDKRALL